MDSNPVTPQGHAHAAGAAPAPGQLGTGHFQHPDAAALQDLVGDIVPVVHYYQAGGDAQLQKEAGFSANIITRLKRNGYISLESIESICRVMNCGVDDILEFVPEDNGGKENG